MMRKATFKPTRTRLGHALRALGLLLSLAALPAYGQHVHQLSYNGSAWVDERLPRALTTVVTSIASILTTPGLRCGAVLLLAHADLTNFNQG